MAHIDIDGGIDGCKLVTVPAVTLEAILAEEQVEKVTLLHQDCEGCEMATISSWYSSGFLLRVQYWTGEIHLGMVPRATEVYHACQIVCSDELRTPFRRWNCPVCAASLAGAGRESFGSQSVELQSADGSSPEMALPISDDHPKAACKDRTLRCSETLAIHHSHPQR